MVAITLGGDELRGLTSDLPAASVRLLLPSPGADDLVVPTWTGNEFLLPGGRRPVIRTFTPRRLRPDEGELDVEIVLHGRGVASTWASAAEPGARAAVSGPGRGYAVDPGAPAFLLAGDESALPAISQLIEALPPATSAEVYVEIASPEARVPLTARPGTNITWCDLPAGAAPGDALVTAVQRAPLVPGIRVWGAGEAAAVQRIRRHLFEEQGLPRAQASVRGYWKHGRTGDSDDAS